jgi:hypothetical protein
MTLFNKFISSLSIVFIMLVGVLAIHSIKVDTIPIDYALGLISKNRSPIFILKANAQCSIGPCATEPTQLAAKAQAAAIEAARQAVSQTVGGVINMIKATLKAIMKVLAMIKKIFNFFITLLQKFAGRDISLFGILSAVNDLSKLDAQFANFKTEWDGIWTDFSSDIDKANQQIQAGQESFQKAAEIYNACIATTLLEENGEKSNVDSKALCNLAINAKQAIRSTINDVKTSGPGAANTPNINVLNPTEVASSQSVTVDGNTVTTTTQTTQTFSYATGPLKTLFNNDPGTTKYDKLEDEAKLTEDLDKARTIAENKKKNAEEAQKFSVGCGAYIGPAQAAALGTEAASSQSVTVEGNTTTTTTSTSAPTLSFTGTVPSFSNSSSSPSIFSSGNTVTTGTAPTNANYSFSRVAAFEQKAFTPEQCENAKDSAKTTQATIDQANQTQQPSETAGGIAAVVAALQSLFEIIALMQQVFQTIMGFINQIMQIGNLFISEFGGLLSSVGNLFAQNGGGSSQSGLLARALSDTPLIDGSAGGQVPTAAGNGQPAIDDGTITINDASVSTNPDNIARYSNQSIDCVLDSVKSKSVEYINQYKASATEQINIDNITKVGVDNILTYTNGSNVPDGVMGASVTDANTPPISGVTYSKQGGASGPVPTTPARSLVASASNNINSTYHTCQPSLWGDDNTIETAGKRLASYPANPNYGGHSVYRDGVSSEWRVVNNAMSKDIPEQCYLTNNDLSNAEKQDIISQLGLSTAGLNQNDSTGASSNLLDQLWNQAKARIDEAQRGGAVRWDPDNTLIYQNRVRGGVVVGSGDQRREIQIKAGRCEVSYTKDQVLNALQSRGWSSAKPESKSFAALVR